MSDNSLIGQIACWEEQIWAGTLGAWGPGVGTAAPATIAAIGARIVLRYGIIRSVDQNGPGSVCVEITAGLNPGLPAERRGELRALEGRWSLIGK